MSDRSSAREGGPPTGSGGEEQEQQTAVSQAGVSKSRGTKASPERALGQAPAKSVLLQKLPYLLLLLLLLVCLLLVAVSFAAGEPQWSRLGVIAGLAAATGLACCRSSDRNFGPGSIIDGGGSRFAHCTLSPA